MIRNFEVFKEKILQKKVYFLKNNEYEIVVKDSLTYLLILNLVKKIRKVFDDEWDFKYSTHEGDTYYIDGLVFKRSQFQIKNERGLTHTIKDLYVYINLTILERENEETLEKNNTLDIVLFGARGLLTPAEINAHYFHSHLPWANGCTEVFHKFCLNGNSQTKIVELEMENFELNSLDNILKIAEKFEIYLISIYNSLSWESLAGTPHRHIKNIKAKAKGVSKAVYDYYEASVFVDRLNNRQKNSLLEYNIVNNKANFKIDQKTLINICGGFVETERLVKLNKNILNLISIKDIKNIYYKYSNIVDRSAIDRIKGKYLLTYKEEKIFIKVEESNNSQFDITVHPMYIETILELILNNRNK